jgi:hypothetical protein
MKRLDEWWLKRNFDDIHTSLQAWQESPYAEEFERLGFFEQIQLACRIYDMKRSRVNEIRLIIDGVSRLAAVIAAAIGALMALSKFLGR